MASKYDQNSLRVGNIFANLPSNIPDELIATLAASRHVRIERIVSHGHASPGDFWYDQSQNEFVILLKGAARLRFDDDSSVLDMKPGDYVWIPAHRRHRVDWTTATEPSVWLAVHGSTDKEPL
jgi:cupin 2 domain-containing protein